MQGKALAQASADFQQFITTWEALRRVMHCEKSAIPCSSQQQLGKVVDLKQIWLVSDDKQQQNHSGAQIMREM